MNIRKQPRNNSGSAILLTVLVVAILLSVGFALSAVFLPKLRGTVDVKNSSAAAYAAETGLEWCLYVHRMTPVSPPLLDNGALYVVTPADCTNVTSAKSIGTFRGVTRSFEITF